GLLLWVFLACRGNQNLVRRSMERPASRSSGARPNSHKSHGPPQGLEGGLLRRRFVTILHRLREGSTKDWLNGRLGSLEASPTIREIGRASVPACIRYAKDRALPARRSRVQSPDQWNEGCARYAGRDQLPPGARARGQPAPQSIPGSSVVAIRRI